MNNQELEKAIKLLEDSGLNFRYAIKQLKFQIERNTEAEKQSEYMKSRKRDLYDN